MMSRSHGYRFAAILLAATAASGCGLKGALTVPSKSEEVVIRASGQAAPAQGETPSATAPAEPAREEPAKPKVERTPPPPLPGDNQGTARGG